MFDCHHLIAFPMVHSAQTLRDSMQTSGGGGELNVKLNVGKTEEKKM